MIIGCVAGGIRYRMHGVADRLTRYLLLALFVTLGVARPPPDATGTGNKHHVTATWSPPDVADAQISRPITAKDNAAVPAYRPHDLDNLPTGNGNRKQKYSAIDDRDYSASLSDGTAWTGNGARQKRYADWTNRKKYGGLLVRGARNMAAVGWNKRPRYNRQDGTTRDWRTNMMRVWGKRSGRLISGSALIRSLF